MILTGLDMQALLGATLIQQFVPFVRTSAPVLNDQEAQASDSARAKLLAAKRTLNPPEPRSPSGWHLMLEDRAEVNLSREEIRVLGHVVEACLQELVSDGEFSAQAGPSVGLAALRAVQGRLGGR
jgi:hypothetical protein